MKEGRKPEKTPGEELQKMSHTTARRFNPQARLKPAQQHWWQARKAEVQTATPHLAPTACKYYVSPDRVNTNLQTYIQTGLTLTYRPTYRQC